MSASKIAELERIISAHQTAHTRTAGALSLFTTYMEKKPRAKRTDDEEAMLRIGKSMLKEGSVDKIKPIEVYAFISGGVLQRVRATEPVSFQLVDYDNIEGGEINPATSEPFENEAAFESAKLGCSIEELEAQTIGVF